MKNLTNISMLNIEAEGIRSFRNPSSLKIYLSARISEDAHRLNNEVNDLLDGRIEMFMPQNHNPYNLDHREFPRQVYQTDLNAMIESDMGLLLPPYGRDCAWEVGWYANSDKPLVVYTEDELEWLRDWMVKGGLDWVITPTPNVYEVLADDPIVADKCLLMTSKQALSDTLLDIFAQSRKSVSPAARVTGVGV